jgi:hypothetical protein
LPIFSGLKLKSPGARWPDFRPSVVAMPEMTVDLRRKKEWRAKIGQAEVYYINMY